MRITESKIRSIIREEARRVMSESSHDPFGFGDEESLDGGDGDDGAWMVVKIMESDESSGVSIPDWGDELDDSIGKNSRRFESLIGKALSGDEASTEKVGDELDRAGVTEVQVWKNEKPVGHMDVNDFVDYIKDGHLD